MRVFQKHQEQKRRPVEVSILLFLFHGIRMRHSTGIVLTHMIRVFRQAVLSPADVSAGLGTYCALICDNCCKGVVRSMLPTESGTLASVDHVMCPYCKSILVYYAE